MYFDEKNPPPAKFLQNGGDRQELLSGGILSRRSALSAKVPAFEKFLFPAM